MSREAGHAIHIVGQTKSTPVQRKRRIEIIDELQAEVFAKPDAQGWMNAHLAGIQAQNIARQGSVRHSEMGRKKAEKSAPCRICVQHCVLLFHQFCRRT
jgi:hypothetical protein